MVHRTRRHGADAVAVPVMIRVFPITTPTRYSDDFGNPRPGPPPHSHAGNDLFAAEGSIIVAVDDGYLTDATNKLGGISFNLKTPRDQMRIYGAHLLEFIGNVPRNVVAGEEIGRVGRSGNAQGTSPHLHFEVHPLGGAAVDPYPYLKAAESRTIYSPPPAKTSPWWAALGMIAGAGVVAFVIRSR